MSRTGMLVIAALLAAGCAKKGGSTGSLVTSQAGGETLASTLQVRVLGDSVRMDLHVTNSTSAAVTLEYPTAQRYEFEVETQRGERVWQWSAGQMFAQATGTQVLSPGETVHHEASWRAGERSGRYVAVARLTASNRSVERRAFFDLP